MAEAKIWKSPHVMAEGTGLIDIRGMWLPMIYLKFEPDKMEKLESFEAREDDVWLMSYPKSGTSWLENIIYLLVKGEDDAETKGLTADERCPYIEGIVPVMDKLKTVTSRRLIKSHLTFQLMPLSVMKNRAKVVYIARNVKDVSVSDYHFHQLITNIDYKGSFEDFYQEFVEGKVCYSDWWSHVAEYWKRKDEDNVLFLKYEDIQKDPLKEIEKVAKHLNVKYSRDTLERVVTNTTFSAMKDNPRVNHTWGADKGIYKKDHTTKFMRKGKVGDWKNYYTKDMSEKVDRLCGEKLDPLGLSFQYEI